MSRYSRAKFLCLPDTLYTACITKYIPLTYLSWLLFISFFYWPSSFYTFFLQCSDSCWRLVHIVYYFSNFLNSIQSTRRIIQIYCYRAGYRINGLGFIAFSPAPGMPNSSFRFCIEILFFFKRLKGKYHRIDLRFLQAQAVWALHPALPYLQLGGTASQPQPTAVSLVFF